MKLRPSRSVQKLTVTDGFCGKIEDKLEKKLLRSSEYSVFIFLFTATLDTGVNLGSTSFMKSKNQVCSQVCTGSPPWPHTF